MKKDLLTGHLLSEWATKRSVRVLNTGVVGSGPTWEVNVIIML